MGNPGSASAAGAAAASARSRYGLDGLNFFTADVETAFGPFVSLLLTREGWNTGAIGTVITLNSAVALATQIPAGFLLDRVRSRRTVVLCCLALLAAGALLIAFFRDALLVGTGEVLHGLTGGAFRTAIAALTIGLVGHRALHHRLGRNQRCDSLGNAVTAAAMGALAQLLSPRAPLLAGAALCIPAALALGAIRGGEIHHSRARQGRAVNEDEVASVRELFRNRGLLVFAASLFLFQFANASVLPLASERLGRQDAGASALFTAALVVIPQLVTALIAGFVADRAGRWGRRAMLVVAFATILVRTALFAVPAPSWFLLPVQALGGIDAAVIGILVPLVVADCTRGTGRYNVALGFNGMVGGIGASISTTATGFVAQDLGFTPVFAALGAVSAFGVAVSWFLFPETGGSAGESEW